MSVSRVKKNREAKQLQKVKQIVKELHKQKTSGDQNLQILASKSGAGEEIRTPDSLLGKQILYR
jgi:hypothetical protein